HLIDVVSPHKQFSVDDFVKLASEIISGLVYSPAGETARGKTKVPIVVGGTGLYVDTLLGRMYYAEAPPNPALGKQLTAKTAAQLLAMLQKLDPRRANTIDKHNPRRLVRAIEIAKALGTNPPAGALPASEQPYDVLWLGLNPGIEKLRKNIRARL